MQAVSLRDRFELQEGRVFLNPMQALVRMALTQAQLDRAAGLNTAGFISGYRGSPLGGLDKALWAESRLLDDAGITFQPGLNEDLAATAVWGSQLTGIDANRSVDGVFGLWYGKGPGVDRSMDALKHANMAGTSRYGGALAIAGDDHGAFSSSLAHQSDHVLIGAAMPLLYPSTLEELIDFGVRGWAMSRFSGCWVGIKLVSEIAETSRVTAVGLARHQLNSIGPQPDSELRWPDPPLDMERRLIEVRLPAVQDFIGSNSFDKVFWRRDASRLGIVAAGKSWLDVREALALLGINEEHAQRSGLALLKPGLIWPLDAAGARQFALGLQELLVVEEKRTILEDQLTSLLYGKAGAPSILGERDTDGTALIPVAGDLQAVDLALTIGGWLARHNALNDAAKTRLEALREETAPKASEPAAPDPRRPFYCAGCPHNTSTRVPTGATAMAGIGCHGMASWIPSRSIVSMTHMGGEGMHWLGRAPFTTEKHIFQNVGDGTYAHSASLNIRAAVAAGVTMTFKILYNEAVAMTGGQEVEGGLTVSQICNLLLAENVTSVTVVTDDVSRFDADPLPKPVTLLPREDLDRVQEELQVTPGVTVLVYAQGCAAEKRRKRKRQLIPDPAVRVMINDLVCEGCGDCSRKSNCVAVQPLETPLGRKRRINQSACNKDLSCLGGFCPSFVSFEGGDYAPQAHTVDETWRASLPAPQTGERGDVFSIAMAGIGGSGVVSAAAIVGMAAHLDGLLASVLDVTGLAQKNGAVYSHIRISDTADRLASGRIPAATANLVLGFDMIAAASEGATRAMHESRTSTFLNAVFTPSAHFIDDGDQDFKEDQLQQRLRGRSKNFEIIDAGGLAERALGDQIYSNLVLLGAAWQSGNVPLTHEALETAITLNGAAVEKSLLAFDMGRLAVADPSRFDTLCQGSARTGETAETDVQAIIERRADFLRDYQDEAYSQRYRALVAGVANADAGFPERNNTLTRAMAQALFKHMAIKDEYEVARLYAETDFLSRAQKDFRGTKPRPVFHLAPPLISRKDPVTGELQKRRFGSWVLPAFRVLAKMKRVRGTAFDVFGRTEERRWERELLARLIDDIEAMLPSLNRDNYNDALRYAELILDIKGFGHVKKANGDRIEPQLAELRDRVRATVVREYAA